MRSTRAQISFEYLVIVGLAILVIVPALLFFLTFASGGDDSVAHTRVAEIGSQLIGTSAEVFALGRNSWLTLDVTLPETVESVTITHYDNAPDELVISYRTSNGVTNGVFFSDVDLANSTAAPTNESTYVVLSERIGVVSLRLTSAGQFVWVELR